MADDAIRIAVVGHANTGKTSLMRTLLRDTRFGTIANHPGSTRHVEGGSLVAGDDAIITLYDTPGLEDSIGLLELLESFFDAADGDGIERLRHLLAHGDQYPQFQQEAKVVRQLLQSDLLFYVIDCREPVLGKYCDELKILQYSARPVIPIQPARLGAYIRNNHDDPTLRQKQFQHQNVYRYLLKNCLPVNCLF